MAGQLVGLCIVFSGGTELIAYVMDSYDLAIRQAIELQKGTKGRYTRKDMPNPDNGNRQTIFLWDEGIEVIMVQETEVGTELLPVKR